VPDVFVEPLPEFADVGNVERIGREAIHARADPDVVDEDPDDRLVGRVPVGGECREENLLLDAEVPRAWFLQNSRTSALTSSRSDSLARFIRIARWSAWWWSREKSRSASSRFIASLIAGPIESDLYGDAGALVAARDRVAGSLHAPEPDPHGRAGAGQVSPPALVLGPADKDAHALTVLFVADRQGELPAAPAAVTVISAARLLISPCSRDRRSPCTTGWPCDSRSPRTGAISSPSRRAALGSAPRGVEQRPDQNVCAGARRRSSSAETSGGRARRWWPCALGR
jgi:hypothetical protein